MNHIVRICDCNDAKLNIKGGQTRPPEDVF